SSATIVTGPGSLGGHCTGFGASFDFAATAQAGLAGSRASVDAPSLANAPPTFEWLSASNAVWADRFSIQSGPATSASITMMWDGALDASVGVGASLPTDAEAGASWGFFVQVPGTLQQVVSFGNSKVIDATPTAL